MSDSLKFQSVSQILASLALSAALQQHFSRGPTSHRSAAIATELQLRKPQATDGWPRPLPQARPRAGGALLDRGTAGGRRAPPAPARRRSRGPELAQQSSPPRGPAA